MREQVAFTALEIIDKTYVKFRGYDANEVEEFLDIKLFAIMKICLFNHDQEAKIQALEEFNYFDEMKDHIINLFWLHKIPLVKQAANERSGKYCSSSWTCTALSGQSKQKAMKSFVMQRIMPRRLLLKQELKNKTRVFHQRLKSTTKANWALSITWMGWNSSSNSYVHSNRMKLSVKLWRGGISSPSSCRRW